MSLLEDKKKLLCRSDLDDVDLKLSVNALRILTQRYLLKDKSGNIIETPKQLFERVAVLAILGDVIYSSRFFSKEILDIPRAQIDKWRREADVYNRCDLVYCNKLIGRYKINRYHLRALANAYISLLEGGRMKCSFNDVLLALNDEEFCKKYILGVNEYYNMMIDQKFLPNTPTLMNAGAPLGMLSACFVLDMEDDMESIMDISKDVAMIFKSGGGVGINYSKLRPEGDLVRSTGGTSSGPLSFMKIVDTIADVVKQGGKRRAANMGILNWNHPDIEKFITAKRTPKVLENFNVSVGLDKNFWKSNRKDYLLDIIAESAWASAEPGLIFFDNVNKYNPILKYKGYAITATNPCSEICMYPDDSCNLGSINISELVKDGEFDYHEFSRVIMTCTAFLDSVIDMNNYPLKRIEEETKKTRRIGLGIMGVADALYKLGIPYNSKRGIDFISDICKRLTLYSVIASSFI
ncbi:MAG: ribonucleotide reductase N-terminal alpha domain-containing protein, partial [Nitrososphaeraceae archaeon]|nr:ribonucleotide reductase N-terminal alpha domain-containing protein [Nitrososphaeraceae archaeon]